MVINKVEKIFSASFTEEEVKVYSVKFGNACQCLKGVLILPKGANQQVTVTLRKNKGATPVFRKLEFASNHGELVDDIPCSVSKSYHPLDIPLQNEILTGSIKSKGAGKVDVFFQYDD